jgi:AbiV family abortive infection protein
MELTAPDLMKGTVYALEQSGYLLHDALMLFRKKRYSSSVVLSIFSKEEMGRFEILVDNYMKAESNKTSVSSESIKKQCDDHVEKIRRSDLGILDIDKLGRPDIAMAILKNPLGSKKRKDALNEAQLCLKKLARKLSDNLHQKRIRALYVEPLEFGMEWNRPSLTSRKECLLLWENTSFEYDVRCDWYKVEVTDPSSLVSRWASRPELPKSFWSEISLFQPEDA